MGPVSGRLSGRVAALTMNSRVQVMWSSQSLRMASWKATLSGFAAWAPLGEGNATVERAEPTQYRPDWGGIGPAAAMLGVTFVGPGAAPAVCERLRRAGRQVVPIGRTRGLAREDLVRNRATAPIEIDPVDGRVTLAGRPLAVEPVRELPLNRRYLLR